MSIWLRLIACFGLSLIGTALAFAEPMIQCQPGSGLWNDNSSGIVLEGAVCSTNAASTDFYRFDFGATKGQFAPAIPGSIEPMRYLFDNRNLLFYADIENVYALEKSHFRVVWHQPWPNAEVVASDPENHTHHAILAQDENGIRMHIVQCPADGMVVEESSLELSSVPLDVVWQKDRLVVIETDQMHVWGHADPGSDGPEWVMQAAVSFEPVTEEAYSLDDSGLMVWNRHNGRLTYYQFDPNSWTRASINATATLKGLGKGTVYATGVTIDANIVRMVARLGVFLKNRFETKYWKLPEPGQAPVAMGQDDIVALDGGSDNRALLIDTTEITWKRLAQVDYPSAGKLADLRHDTLITIHPDGREALVAWHARTGSKIAALMQDQLGSHSILKAGIIPSLPQFVLVTLSDDQYVIFDLTNSQIAEVPADWISAPWRDLPLAVSRISHALVLQDAPAEAQSTSWTILADHAHPKTVTNVTVKGLDPAQFEELQTPQEKWYGYCLSQDDCFVPSSEASDHLRELPNISLKPDDISHAPTWLAWMLAGIAFLSIFAVMLWRHGFGRKSLLKSPSDDNDDIAPTDIFDSENRRFISDRDNRYFLAPGIFATPIFRICISIVIGLAVALIVAVPFFFDDAFTTFLSWIVVLSLPVIAVVWIAISWTYWNRYYLLRFGCIAEGKWLNCARSNQSIAYAPDKRVSYEMSRRQWERPDIVPIILFDPARPNFAIQYTGGSNHAVIPSDDVRDNPKPACTYDLLRLIVVLGLLAVTLCGTQMLYRTAFPNPLSAWKLRNIAYTLENSQTYTMACLDVCSSSDETCHEQCHHHQLSLVLDRMNTTSDEDPDMSPAQFLDTQRQKVAAARQILDSQDACVDKEKRIAALSLWPDELTQSFWQVYSDRPTFDAAKLSPIFEGLKTDTQYLRDLCDRDLLCAHDAQNCHTPPVCPGSIAALKIRVCSFQNAIHLPEGL